MTDYRAPPPEDIISVPYDGTFLQCVVVCCSVLQCVAVIYDVLRGRRAIDGRAVCCRV